MYVIVRNDGFFVRRPGLISSYTKDIRQAWIFSDRDVAEANRCLENETVRDVSEFLEKP